MVKTTFFAFLVLALVCVLLFGATTLTNGGTVYKTFATHPDTPPSGGLLLWAKTDGTFQTTNSSGTDAGMGGGVGGPTLLRPPVAVDDTTGWTDYGSTTGRTIDTSNAGIVILTSGTGAGSTNVQGRKMAVTAPFSKIFVLMPFIGYSLSASTAYNGSGILAADSTGKAIGCSIGWASSKGGYFGVTKYDSPTVANATQDYVALAPFSDFNTDRGFPGIPSYSYWKIDDTGGTLRCQWSPDGYAWQTLWSAPDTQFLTAPPTAVAYYTNGYASGSRITAIVRGVE
jgi:hypothetical protein